MAARSAGETTALTTESRAVDHDQRVSALHVNAGNLYGGVETLLVTCAQTRHQCPKLEQQFAVCYEGRLSEELIQTGAPVHMLGAARFSRPWTIWQARRRFERLLRSRRFDLVVCHMSWSLAVFGPAARAAGHKVALWTHGFQTRRTWLDGMARHAKPDVAITNSQFTAMSVQSQFPELRQQILYYPIAPPPAAAAKTWRIQVRRKFAIEDDTAVILQVSRMEPWKGHKLLLQGLAQIKDLPKWVCWIAGGSQKRDEEEYVQSLQSMTRDLGLGDRVRFLGQRSDVPQLMAAADVFCQPNLEPEPFGIVFVEALWAGRPVVTTKMGGAEEIVDESCGLLSRPGDASELAQRLRRLIESPALRATLGSGGPARAHELCDPASQMSKLEEIVRSSRSERR